MPLRAITWSWCRAAAFENIVQALYVYAVPKPKNECTKTEQLGVSFAAGYLAGILCATISHPADNLVSKLNASKVSSHYFYFIYSLHIHVLIRVRSQLGHMQLQ